MSNEMTQKKPVYEVAITQAQSQFEEAAQRTGMDWRAEMLFAMQSMANNPFLTDVARNNPLSLRMAMVNVAAIGISLNPATAMAFLVPREGKVILDISYRGLIKLATDTGSIQWAKAELVYAKDSFTYKGPGLLPEHHSDPFDKDRGEFRGVYCVAKLASGEYLVETMSAEDIYTIRDLSDLYAKKKKGPWINFFGEQAKKTCIKRAQKTWPKSSPRLSQAIDYLNKEAGEGIDFNSREKDSRPAIEMVPTDDMIQEAIRQKIMRVVDRAVKVAAWKPADDYLREKYSGPELAWALDQLKKSKDTFNERAAAEAAEAIRRKVEEEAKAKAVAESEEV